MDPTPGRWGPFWTPITPEAGSLFHAGQHTASENHVLVATTYSKSVLRAVAGDLAEDHDDVFYFPSYEIIASHPGQGRFFNRDQRTVNPSGVDFVMRHFFSGPLAREFGAGPDGGDDLELMCDERVLERE